MGALRRDHGRARRRAQHHLRDRGHPGLTLLRHDATFILSGLNTWGWIILILGVVQLVAAYSIWKGGQTGRWFGITVALFNAVAALMSIAAYPFWSLAVFTLDILVIYGLTAYGGDPDIVD